MSEVLSALATYQIWKTGFAIFILVLFLCIAIYSVYYIRRKNYVSTDQCNIVYDEGNNFTETITYTVNNKVYKKKLPAKIVTKNNVSNKEYAHSEGSCTVYYTRDNPNDYSININPTAVIEIIAIVLFIICICIICWFMFLRAHRDVAGVVGGIDAASSVLSVLKKN